MLGVKSVCMVGLGYIGLPTAALLANYGHSVHGVDVSEEVVNTINEGNAHIVEPDLHTFVRAAVDSGHLKASLTPIASDVYIIAVPTPFQNGYTPNLEHVYTAAKSIAPLAREGNLVILESTSPVGTTQEVKQILAASSLDLSRIYLAHCPERVLPGQIMKELIDNDRIIGGINPESSRRVAEFYRSFVKGRLLLTDDKTAEMAKLSENAFRDLNIAFANELSILCHKFGIDVRELIELANHHPRVNILKSGPGVGGHCIAVDPWFIVHSGGAEARIIRTAREVNNYKTEWVFQQIVKSAAQFRELRGGQPIIACLGLAYKPDIDDLRESPALYITKKLKEVGHKIMAVEPNIQKLEGLDLSPAGRAVKEADILVFLVGHREFSQLQIPVNKTVLDFCGIGK